MGDSFAHHKNHSHHLATTYYFSAFHEREGEERCGWVCPALTFPSSSPYREDTSLPLILFLPNDNAEISIEKEVSNDYGIRATCSFRLEWSWVYYFVAFILFHYFFPYVFWLPKSKFRSLVKMDEGRPCLTFLCIWLTFIRLLGSLGVFYYLGYEIDTFFHIRLHFQCMFVL